MKKILLFAFIVVMGCTQKEKAPYLIRGVQVLGNWDSVYLYSDGHLNIIGKDPLPTKRYFLISYKFRLKYSDPIGGDGNTWFSADAFPNKANIDSIVFAGLDHEKSCYQPILVNSIYEFKNEEDFNSYVFNYPGSKKTPANLKKICK